MTEPERMTRNSARAIRRYSVPPEKLLGAVEQAMKKLPHWRLEFAGERGLRAVRKTRILRQEDEVTVRVRDRDWGFEAAFESASRTGLYDFGRNRRNLQLLLAAVDQELA